MKRSRRTLALTVLVAALSGTIAAAMPGATNVSFRAAIYSIRDDGTGRRLIARPEPAVARLVRSADGYSILYARDVNGVVALFAADTFGENAVRLTPPDLSATIYPGGVFSPDGRMIAFSSFVDCGYRCYHSAIYVVRRDGSGLRLLAENAAEPSWASDSRRLAYGGLRGTYGSSRGIYVADIESNRRRLVARGRVDRPVWAPRGERIAYTANLRGYGVACFVNADGSRRHCTRGHSLTSLVWSRDGKRVAFRQANPRRLGFVDSDARHIGYLGDHGRHARPAAWSPDGRRLAFWFGSYGSFGGVVRVLRIAAPERSLRVVNEGGALADLRWRGREISYVVTGREEP
jgi:Tol biopolymer transport system component